MELKAVATKDVKRIMKKVIIMIAF